MAAAARAIHALPRTVMDQRERDMNAWMMQHAVAIPTANVAAYQTEYQRRYGPHPTPSQLVASATIAAARVMQDHGPFMRPVAFILAELLEPLVIDGHGPGTPEWFYAVERIPHTSTTLYRLRANVSPGHRGAHACDDARHARLDAIHAGLMAEEIRRGRERMIGGSHDDGRVDWLALDTHTPTGLPRLDRDTTGIVAQLLGERLARPGLVHMPSSGPMVSRATMLHRIAARVQAEAAIAARAAPAAAAAAAAASLARVASELNDLVESVAKKARKE